MKIKNIKVIYETKTFFDIRVEKTHNYFITNNKINVHNSGKSYVVGKTTSGLGLKIINSDDVFEKMLKDAGLKPDIETIFSDKGQNIRNRAKETTGKMQKNYIEGRLGVVIDGTGKDFTKIKKQSDSLKELGYDTSMIFVNTSLEVAQERNLQRARQLDPKEVEKMWLGVQQNIGKFQNYFGQNNFIIVDNNSATENIFDIVWKQVMKFASKKPDNVIAKKWIEKELKNRNRS